MTKGVVYTPAHWAEWAVKTYGIADLWMKGNTVLDIGCGRGALICAVIAGAVTQKFTPSESDLGRLQGIDVDGEALKELRRTVEERFGLRLPEKSLIHGDYLISGPGRGADIVFANPPWVSFGDLDEKLKERYKPLFRQSGLTPNPRDLLLGGSRIDIAALFVATALRRDLNPRGRAFFFLPSSLYRGEGAHAGFRRLRLPDGRRYSLDEYRDISSGPPFPGTSTRRCFVSYRTEGPQSWPIGWYDAAADGSWNRREASPVAEEGSPLVPHRVGASPAALPRVPVPPGVRPRQGVNTGGASEVYIFNRLVPTEANLCRVTNRKGETGLIKSEWLHPLMEPSIFDDSEAGKAPSRWIFLPYDTEGRLLNWNRIAESPQTAEWLERHRTRLVNRKGSIIRRRIDAGSWWSLLGVGPYSFAPWKVAWESYGKKRFLPRLFGARDEGHWQGNQALHSFIAFSAMEPAVRALKALQLPALEKYLRNLGGAGTKCWAQPGRMRRVFVDDSARGIECPQPLITKTTYEGK